MMAGCILTGCGSAESGSLEAADKVAETANAPAAGNGEEGPGGTSGEPAEVSVIIETFDNTFASFVMNAMKKYEEEHKDKIHITYLDSKQDANTQISQVENQILNGTQAIICLAVDAKQSEPIVRACKEAGVPLIAFNRIFENCDSFVGADGAVAGSLLARFTGEKTGGKGNVAIVNGIMGQENQFIRRDAIVETLGEMYPDMQVVIEGAGDWKRDKALQLVETWLQSGTDIDAILCLNDDMAMVRSWPWSRPEEAVTSLSAVSTGIRMESMRSGTARLLPPYSRIPTARQRKRWRQLCSIFTGRSRRARS